MSTVNESKLNVFWSALTCSFVSFVVMDGTAQEHIIEEIGEDTDDLRTVLRVSSCDQSGEQQTLRCALVNGFNTCYRDSQKTINSSFSVSSFMKIPISIHNG